MKKRVATILSLVVLTALPAATEASARNRTPRVVTASGGTPRYAGFQRRPSRIVYSGDGAALLAGGGRISNHMTWTTWTNLQGRGQGADWRDNCVPDCAQGTYFAYRANIRAYRPRSVGGYLLFTRITVTYSGARPPFQALRHGSVTFNLDYGARDNIFFWAGG